MPKIQHHFCFPSSSFSGFQVNVFVFVMYLYAVGIGGQQQNKAHAGPNQVCIQALPSSIRRGKLRTDKSQTRSCHIRCAAASVSYILLVVVLINDLLFIVPCVDFSLDWNVFLGQVSIESSGVLFQ